MAREPLPELPYWDGPLSHPFYSHVVKRILDFAAALLLKHRENLVRLRSGEELRFHFLWRRSDESERFGIVDDGKEIFKREIDK